MMMGSLEEDINQANTIPEDIPEVVNDLDIEDDEVAVESMEVKNIAQMFVRKKWVACY